MDLDDPQGWEALVRDHTSHRHGFLQREDAQVEDAEAPYLHLAKHLLEEYAFGGLSANQVQHLTMMAKLDGLKHTSVHTLAGLGTTGKHTQHIHMDLLIYMKSYLHPIVQLEPACVHIPLKVLKGPNAGIHLLPL